MRMSAISLQLYGVKNIPQQNSEIESIHLIHHRYSHILISDILSKVCIIPLSLNKKCFAISKDRQIETLEDDTG